MEKQVELKEAKSADVQSIIAGVLILFSAVTAILGYVELSLCCVMVFAVFCVMSCMAKDLIELCNSIVEEEESFVIK